MFEELKSNMNNCYAPYSNYKVSCCLATKEGKKYFGVNVENGSYGGSICAERVAITKAISEGEKPFSFSELHILGSGDTLAMPCFICRQTFVEFFDKDVLIYVYDSKGEYTKYRMSDLCPLPFDLGGNL